MNSSQVNLINISKGHYTFNQIKQYGSCSNFVFYLNMESKFQNEGFIFLPFTKDNLYHKDFTFPCVTYKNLFFARPNIIELIILLNQEEWFRFFKTYDLTTIKYDNSDLNLQTLIEDMFFLHNTQRKIALIFTDKDYELLLDTYYRKKV